MVNKTFEKPLCVCVCGRVRAYACVHARHYPKNWDTEVNKTEGSEEYWGFAIFDKVVQKIFIGKVKIYQKNLKELIKKKKTFCHMKLRKISSYGALLDQCSLEISQFELVNIKHLYQLQGCTGCFLFIPPDPLFVFPSLLCALGARGFVIL